MIGTQIKLFKAKICTSALLIQKIFYLRCIQNIEQNLFVSDISRLVVIKSYFKVEVTIFILPYAAEIFVESIPLQLKFKVLIVLLFALNINAVDLEEVFQL